MEEGQSTATANDDDVEEWDFSFCLANAKTVVYDSLPFWAHANRNDAKGNRDNLKSSNKTMEMRRQQPQQRRWRRPAQARLSYLYGNFLPFSSPSSSSSSSFLVLLLFGALFFLSPLPFSNERERVSECVVDIFISFYFREAEKKSTLKFMGNFAHKFNTRDIKPKLARKAKEITCEENEPKKKNRMSEKKIVYSDIVRQLSTLSRIQFASNALHTFRRAIKCVLLRRIASFSTFAHYEI